MLISIYCNVYFLYKLHYSNMCSNCMFARYMCIINNIFIAIFYLFLSLSLILKIIRTI